MTVVGRRPTLYELLEALHAIEKIEADIDALDPQKETFRVVLTFQRGQCPNDWQDSPPKPTWLFEQIMEELSAWLLQRNKEEEWISKEAQFGASIDTVMAHWAEELQKVAAAPAENLFARAHKRILSNTIMRLAELKERRAAGGVHSATESNREKARKTWVDDEYEAIKREEEQRRRQKARDKTETPSWFGADFVNEEMNREWDGIFGFGYKQRKDQHKAPPLGKKPWWVILGVPSTASVSEINKAYRRLASSHHPDKHRDPNMRELAEARMKEINTARDEGLGGLR